LHHPLETNSNGESDLFRVFKDEKIEDLSFFDSTFNMSGETGLVFSGDNHEISFGVFGARVWSGRKGYSSSYGLWLRGSKEIDSTNMLSGSLSLSRLHYDTSIQKEGWELSVVPSLRHQFSPSLTLTLSSPFILHKVKRSDESYIMSGLSLGVDMPLPSYKNFSNHVETHVLWAWSEFTGSAG
jgi:Surface lipoprotein assembly modifier